MGIIFDANEMHTMMNSMNQNMHQKIQDIQELKKEISGLINEEKLQGKAYASGKEYFRCVWLPLLSGIEGMCSSTIQANNQYMNLFHSEVDGSPNAYIDTDYLKEGIKRLDYLRAVMDNDIGIPSWMSMDLYDNLYETRQLQDVIDRLYGFDAHAEKYYEEASWYYDRVKSGMSMLSSGTWDEVNGKFKLDIAKMHWAGEIYSKNEKEGGATTFHDGLLNGMKKFLLSLANDKQARLLEEYDDASSGRQTEIIKELEKNTKFKQLFTDYQIHLDDWQLQIIGWDKEIVDKIDLKDMNTMLAKYEITTIERKRHFFAQISHETGTGVTLYEDDYGNPNYFDGYDGLYGNINQGDGSKYRGAGYIQFTFKDHYQKFADAMGDQEIVNKGFLYLAENYAWESAGYYWVTMRNINEKIDNGATVEEVTYAVNGGYNGLPEREDFYEKTKVTIY